MSVYPQGLGPALRGEAKQDAFSVTKEHSKTSYNLRFEFIKGHLQLKKKNKKNSNSTILAARERLKAFSHPPSPRNIIISE